MVKKPFLYKAAFSMIELIFAIVIIAITVISLPMMTQVTSQGIERNLVQEAIFAASAELNQALSFRWDRNSAEGSATAFSKVINMDNNGDGIGDNNCNNAKRPGHAARSCRSDLLGVANVTDANITNLNNAEHGSQTIFVGDATTAAGYKQDYNSELNVTTPSSFGGFANSPNIKRVRIQVSDADGVVVQLDSFSCNIGEVDYAKRSYQ